MNNLHRAFWTTLGVFFLLAPGGARANQGGRLTSQELEQVRDAQEASERIKVYLILEQKRLNRIEELREGPPETQENAGGQVDKLLGEFISIDDELKDWIQYQYNRKADMRAGLRQLLKDAPQQLQALQRIQNSPGPQAADYSQSLSEAIANLSDTINGATQAFGGQQKEAQEAGADQKADRRALKKARKEEEKRNKEEKKLNKKEKKHKKQDAGDSGGN
jgi:hypothetical protein